MQQTFNQVANKNKAHHEEKLARKKAETARARQECQSPEYAALRCIVLYSS